LDTALIQRIEGVTRVIPVRVSDVEVPTALRALRWIDLTGDVDVGMRELLAAIYQVHERPAIGRPPAFISNARSVVPGLSRLGSILAAVLLTTGKHESGSEEELSAQQLAARTGLTPEETDDAIDELEALGYVRTRNYFGTWPFTHGDVEPTYALFLNSHQDVLGYGPMEDVKAVASAVAAKKQLDGSEIMRLTGLSPLRINRAVDYLEDYGLVTVLREMGTSPFSFGVVSASGRTRRFVSEQAK
jgi:DNA-binding transcriptional regulator YhcF (GntR family)